jgi:sec-independent protein translocase protein TatC
MAKLPGAIQGARIVGERYVQSQRKNPEGRMPLFDHLRELRNRVVKMAIGLIAGMVVGFVFFTPVWHFIERPLCRATIRGVSGCKTLGTNQLVLNGPLDPFYLRVKVALIVGILLSSPVWLYQLWAFIAPGLYRRERRWAYYFVGSAVPLFALGATLAYFAMTRGLHFLLDMVPAGVTPLITISTYLSYAGAMLLIFGVAFEMPLIFVLLNLAGVLTHERFRKWRRGIIFAVFAFAAIFTPSPDPFSMLLLAIPCVVLVEGAEIFSWVHDRRKAARLGSLAFPGLSQEEVARYGLESPLQDESASSPTGTGSPS